MSLFGDESERASDVGTSERSDASFSDRENDLASGINGEDSSVSRSTNLEVLGVASSVSYFANAGDGRLARREEGRRRQWFKEDTRLVEAFETAVEGDLAINLLGVALERRASPEMDETQMVRPWVSKARWPGMDAREATKIGAAWTAWPLPPQHLPSRVERLGRARKMKGRTNMWQQNLDDAISCVILGQAGKLLKEKQSLLSITGQLDSSRIRGLEIAEDEDEYAAMLQPIVSRASEKLSALFLALETSHRAQFPQAVSHSSGRKRKRQTRRLSNQEAVMVGNLRDWSDVLSMAASLGWNQQAIQRTIQKCSTLFRESMTTAQLATNVSGDGANMDAGLGIEPPISLDHWMYESMSCPHKDCHLHQKTFGNGAVLARHIEQEHGWDIRVCNLRKKNTFVDGIRNDGFLELIDVVPKWRPYLQAKKRTKEAVKAEPE